MPDSGRFPLRWCKDCHRSSQDVKFPPTGPRCMNCKGGHEAARHERLAILRPSPIAAAGEPGPDPRENPEHLDWIRKLPCAVHNHTCSKVRHAHHVRSAATAGTGMKPPDADTVCLCSIHHDEGHRIGWQSFQIRYGIGLRQLATDLAAQSPHIRTGR